MFDKDSFAAEPSLAVDGSGLLSRPAGEAKDFSHTHMKNNPILSRSN
jgi:hypothetical protein